MQGLPHRGQGRSGVELQTEGGSIVKFGDIIVNHHAGENNPHRTGIFVRNNGKHIQLTDGKGDFWNVIHDKDSQSEVVGRMGGESQKMAETLFETIETAIYELEQLERVLDMPERGYVRNGYNAVLRTLREGTK